MRQESNQQDIYNVISRLPQFIELAKNNGKTGWAILEVDGIFFIVFHNIDDTYSVYLQDSEMLWQANPDIVRAFCHNLQNAMMQLNDDVNR